MNARISAESWNGLIREVMRSRTIAGLSCKTKQTSGGCMLSGGRTGRWRQRIHMRVMDGSVLQLIAQWLKAPVEEQDENGRPGRWKRNDKGTSEVGVISPLLANIYLHWFDHVFHARNGPPNGRKPCW